MDSDKNNSILTRDELLEELDRLRQRVADLEFLETELVSIAATQQTRQEQYRVLVEEINDVIFAVDRDKTVTYVSPVIQRISGYAPSEIRGHSFLEFVYAADAPSLEARFQESMADHHNPLKARFRVVTKAGEIRWMRTCSRPIQVEKRTIGLRGVMMDITKRVEMEKEQERLIAELQEALAEVKTLKELLPICSSCKRIRDDQEDWIEIEEYLRQHSTTRFTHDLCADCAKELYPEVYETIG